MWISVAFPTFRQETNNRCKTWQSRAIAKTSTLLTFLHVPFLLGSCIIYVISLPWSDKLSFRVSPGTQTKTPWTKTIGKTKANSNSPKTHLPALRLSKCHPKSCCWNSKSARLRWSSYSLDQIQRETTPCYAPGNRQRENGTAQNLQNVQAFFLKFHDDHSCKSYKWWYIHAYGYIHKYIYIYCEYTFYD